MEWTNGLVVTGRSPQSCPEMPSHRCGPCGYQIKARSCGLDFEIFE